ncbi:MAG: TIGR04053 family radical SAM/SPASM domain-containing protein [Chloroflexi bacterium]|nr:TIGR04053 family radical SAM/SPASM domain-containing protein [Chloroflexota bacterium]
MTGHEITPLREGGRPPFAQVDFDQTPFIVFWEVTRACALACLHCRATAQPRRHPEELTTQEGFNLIDQLVDIGRPLLVITGGDPMMRPDLYALIAYGNGKGLRVSLAPSATKLVTRRALERVKEAGVARLSLSLDGPDAEAHDAFRRTPGSYQRSMEILQDARELGISLQVNSTVSRYNVKVLDVLMERVAEFQPAVWSLFFLVPTGRGQKEDMISPQEHEAVFRWLYHLSHRVPFDVKTTAAEHYRRVVIQMSRGDGASEGPPGPEQVLVAPGFSFQDGIGRSAKGVNDGRGCCFISHVGDVCPSGFLPLVGGSLRRQSLAEIYRHSPLFRDLRDVAKLKGKCGRCEYNQVCGGSRARAYAVTGDYLAAEPYCVYQPTETRVA